MVDNNNCTTCKYAIANVVGDLASVPKVSSLMKTLCFYSQRRTGSEIIVVLLCRERDHAHVCVNRVINKCRELRRASCDESLGDGPLNLERRRLKDHFINVCEGRMGRSFSQAPLRPNGVTRGNGYILKHSILWN